MGRKVKISGKFYPIELGYGTLRTVGKKWKCKGVASTFKVIEKLFSSEDGIPFEMEDKFIDLIVAGVEKADPKSDISKVDPEEILTSFVFDPANMEEFAEAFQDSAPIANSGNPQPRKKAGKKKK